MKVIRPSWLNSADRSSPKHTMSVLSLDLHPADAWLCTCGQTDASAAIREQFGCSHCGYLAVWNFAALDDATVPRKLIWFKHTGPDASITQISWFPDPSSSVLASTSTQEQFELWNLQLDDGCQAAKDSKKPIWTQSGCLCFAWGSLTHLAVGGRDACRIFELGTEDEDPLMLERTIIRCDGSCVAVAWHRRTEHLAMAVKKEESVKIVISGRDGHMISEHNALGELLTSALCWHEEDLLYAYDTGVKIVWDAITEAKEWLAYTLVHKEIVTAVKRAYCPERRALLTAVGTSDGEVSLWPSSILGTDVPSDPLLVVRDLLQGKITGIAATRSGLQILVASHDADSQISSVVLLKLDDSDKFEYPAGCSGQVLCCDDGAVQVGSGEEFSLVHAEECNDYKVEWSRLCGPADKIARACVSSNLLALSTCSRLLHIYDRRMYTPLTKPIVQCGPALALRACKWHLLYLEELQSVPKQTRCVVLNCTPPNVIGVAEPPIPSRPGNRIIHLGLKVLDDGSFHLVLIFDDLRVYRWTQQMRCWAECNLTKGENVPIVNPEELLDPEAIVMFPV